MREEMLGYLTGPRHTAERIRQIKEKRLELISSLGPTAIRYDKDRVMSTPEDKMLSIMSEVADLDEEIRELKDSLRDQRRQLSADFSTLEPTDEKMMRLRYLEGASWEVIALATHRSLSTCFRHQKLITDNNMWTYSIKSPQNVDSDSRKC